jgi:hypothetical protein
MTPKAGPNTPDTHRTLHPRFVEALMDWLTGWIGFGSVAMVWSP